MEDVLEPHQQATAGRAAMEPVVLTVQDTTMLDYSLLRDTTDGLISIGGAGVAVHTTLVVTEASRPLGVLDLDSRFRKSEHECLPENPIESERWLRGLQRSAQLGEACPDTRVVNVCDWEGDMWEMFQKQSECQSTGLLVRANPARYHKVAHADGSEEDLQRYMEQLPVTAKCQIELTARWGHPVRSKRKVKLQVRVAPVQLLAPGSSGASLPMIAVLAQEPTTPSKGSPVRWLLLCTEGEATAKNALRILHWYRRRWDIKEFFRILKFSTRIESFSFYKVESVLKCLAFDAVTAWCVLSLQRMVRDEPHRAATDVVSKDTIFVMYLLLYNRAKVQACPLPDWSPNVRTFVVDLFRFAEFEPSKHREIPGVIEIGQAMNKLTPIVRTHELLKQDGMLVAVPSSTAG